VTRPARSLIGLVSKATRVPYYLFGIRIERTREMRSLIVSTFMTLDGVVQAPGGPEEDDSSAFAHGGWSVNYWDEQMGQVMGEAMSAPFDLVSRTQDP
jgi:hypothetical protein